MIKEQNLVVRIVMAVLMAWLLPAEMFAQKDIDKLLSKYADKPYTVYTCIVRRNPRTRKVSKVIKSLTVANPSVYRQFESAFRSEGKRADYVNASNGGGSFSSVLRFNRSAYIFSSEGDSQCTVTVIWRDDDGSENLLDNEHGFDFLEQMTNLLEKRIEGSSAQIEGSERLLRNINDFSIELSTPEN